MLAENMSAFVEMYQSNTHTHTPHNHWVLAQPVVHLPQQQWKVSVAHLYIFQNLQISHNCSYSPPHHPTFQRFCIFRDTTTHCFVERNSQNTPTQIPTNEHDRYRGVATPLLKVKWINYLSLPLRQHTTFPFPHSCTHTQTHIPDSRAPLLWLLN